MFGNSLRARERRTIVAGAAVSAAALVFAFAILPFARHWQAREDVIAAEADRLARLRGLISHQDALQQLLNQRSQTIGETDQRLLSARTPALAASNLQALLQSLADQSRVTISQLDVAGAPDTTDIARSTIPATLSAIGDIYGMAELLSLIQHGTVLVEIRELTVRPNPALKGELLQMTLSLRAPYVMTESS